MLNSFFMPKLSQKSLQYKVLANIKDNKLINPGERVVVAVSGGADSVCLFDVLFEIKEELKIKLLVCHYNHRLRGEDSYNDFEFVKKFAESRGVEFIGGEAKKDNLFKGENEAREARYAFFEKILKEGRGDRVAIAHNKNDLVETFLLRLVRGSGMRGLRSIPFSRQKFIRPLLSIPRSEIDSYLKKAKISHRTDITNEDIEYTRNFIRHEVTPLLMHINPNFLETLSSNIAAIEEDSDLLDRLSGEAYTTTKLKESKEKIVFSRKKWLDLHPALRTGVLRLGISKLASLENITYKQINEVKKMIEKGEGKKYKPLPHSLRIRLQSGNIIILVEKTD
jgi:tRNA(Ile)-lysidine synthase